MRSARRRASTAAGLLFTGVFAAASPAGAHQSSLAYSTLIVDGADLDFAIQMANTDLFQAVGIERDRPVTRDEVLAGRDRLFAWLAANLRIEQRAAACPARPVGLEFLDKLDGFFVTARLRFHCPGPIESPGSEARLTYDLFFDLDPRHQGVARVLYGSSDDTDQAHEQILREGRRTLELRREPSAWDHARQFLHLGVEHIFTGYDHIAFVFALLALAGAHGLRAGGRRVLGVVTAFTIAHSITLIASAAGVDPRMPLRVVPAVVAVLLTQVLVEDRRVPRAPPAVRAARLVVAALLGLGAAELSLRLAPALAVDPSRVVEASIALSIVYVAVENLAVAAPEHRFLITFCFGLIHGFGFASVLREIGLPERGLLLSLVSFNVGVEIGQLAVVAAVLPLLATIARPSSRRPVVLEVGVLAAVALATFLLFRRFDVPTAPLAAVVFGGAPLLYVLGRRFGYTTVVRRGGSAAVAALAAFWFLERVVGRSWMGGRLG